MDLITALILGIVEGLTEFLPVSSTAHLILLSKVLAFDDPSGAFKVAIQLGAILALIVLYFSKIISTVAALPTRPEARRFALSVAIAFLPAVVFGLLLGDIIDKLFLEGQINADAARIIAYTLIGGGIVMLLTEKFAPRPKHDAADALPFGASLVVGVFQAMALVPGVSRSGATIVGAMLMGVERKAAAEFSFFLSIPTMVAAVGYKVFQDRDQLDFAQAELIGVGFIAAFIAAILVVRAFLAIVGRVGFWPFACYRILLGGALLYAAATSMA